MFSLMTTYVLSEQQMLQTSLYTPAFGMIMGMISP